MGNDRGGFGTRFQVARVVLTVGLGLVALFSVACGDDTDSVTSDDTTDGPASTSAASNSSDDLDDKAFVATEVTGGETVVDGTEIRVEFADGRVAVSGGCNQMSGPVTIGDERLELDGEMMSTMIGCDDAVMAQDDWVSAFFAAGPAWSLDGKTLELVGDDGVTIVLEEEQPVPDAELVGPTWTAESIYSADAVSSVAGDPPTFVFGDDGTVAVFDGCNTGSASYEVDGDAITFEPGPSTLMECPDETSQLWADAVAGMFAAPGCTSPTRCTVTYSIEGDVLSLRADDGSGLDFRAAT